MEEDIIQRFLKEQDFSIEGNWYELKQAIENLINRNKQLLGTNLQLGELLKEDLYIPKSKVREKIEILEKCTTNIDRKVNLTDYIIIGETERAVGRFVNLDFIKKVLLEEPGYDIELLQEGDK